MYPFYQRIHHKLLLAYYKIYSLLKFGCRINVFGDPRKLILGKGCSIESGVRFYVNNGSIEIGDHCFIFTGVIFNTYGGKIKVGNDCTFNPYSIIYGDGNTFIGNNVRIAAHTVIVPANHNYMNRNIPIKDQGSSKKGIFINDDVWIGAGVSILDGVVVNKGAVIGAGSVVKSDIPQFAVCVGVPAKVIKYRQ